MDSDLPVSFEDTERVLRVVPADVDMVIGYRLGRAEGLFREVQSWGYNAMLRTLFGLRVRDVNFAFKLFRRELVAEPLQAEGSFIDAEMLLRAQMKGYNMRQVGLQYHVRKAGQSTLGSPKVIPKLLKEMLTYRWKSWKGRGPAPREVIFNADDFGLCESINAGVIASHQRGVVRSASLIVTGDAFDAAVAYAKKNPALDLGLHFSLCGGKPVCDPAQVPSLVKSDGVFPSNYADFLKRYLSGRINLDDVEREFRAQFHKAHAAGLTISHLDSHQHLHVLPSILRIVVKLAEENNIIAVRYPHERALSYLSGLFSRRLFRTMERMALSLTCQFSKFQIIRSNVLNCDHFLGVTHAGRWNIRNLHEQIESLSPGVTEICCHPRSEPATEAAYDWGYATKEELEALTSDEIQRTLDEQKVRVTTFRERFIIPA